MGPCLGHFRITIMHIPPPPVAVPSSVKKSAPVPSVNLPGSLVVIVSLTTPAVSSTVYDSG